MRPSHGAEGGDFMNRVQTRIPAQHTGPTAGTFMRARTRLVISAL
jgi:hypothetical protein